MLHTLFKISRTTDMNKNPFKFSWDTQFCNRFKIYFNAKNVHSKITSEKDNVKIFEYARNTFLYIELNTYLEYACFCVNYIMQ